MTEAQAGSSSSARRIGTSTPSAKRRAGDRFSGTAYPRLDAACVVNPDNARNGSIAQLAAMAVFLVRAQGCVQMSERADFRLANRLLCQLETDEPVGAVAGNRRKFPYAADQQNSKFRWLRAPATKTISP